MHNSSPVMSIGYDSLTCQTRCWLNGQWIESELYADGLLYGHEMTNATLSIND